jgi:hypothetical protein
MSKHDLKARPIYHHKRESIQAHLSIVFAALAVTRFIEDRTGWSIKRFVQPPAATAPSASAPANRSSPPKTHSPQIYGMRSRSSAERAVCTNLMKVGTTIRARRRRTARVAAAVRPATGASSRVRRAGRTPRREPDRRRCRRPDPLRPGLRSAGCAAAPGERGDVARHQRLSLSVRGSEGPLKSQGGTVPGLVGAAADPSQSREAVVKRRCDR